MVLDSGVVFMDQVDGVRSSRELNESTATPRPPTKRSDVNKRERSSHNGLPVQSDSSQAVPRRSSLSTSSRGGATPRPSLRRPLSLEVTPHLRGCREQTADRRVVQPPWRSGSAAPSPPTRSLTSPSLGAGGWMRRSESTCSVNYPLGMRVGRGQMRPATSLPHIAKGTGRTALPTSTRPCLLVALRPLNLEQEKQTFFMSDYKYEPQFEYTQPEPRSVLDKYKEGSGLFLEQAVGIMECVLRKYGSYENFEDVTGGSVLPKSQIWAAVRKYLQKEGCVGERERYGTPANRTVERFAPSLVYQSISTAGSGACRAARRGVAL
ncbi:uncharacterized protein KIAA0895-like [Cheilinus undulatus]|uniref:uncharacterized protein KIAA0895-like n=1 Tax=Cheilinus undulatus TaxID=241271 RepID=UPI001BD640E4|nr:uncharacterized protein KIAA0895-like [Cheilinus undulatus]